MNADIKRWYALRLACRGLFGAGVLLLGASVTLGGAEEKKTKVVEINIRNLDAAEAAKISYVRQIKPIIVDNCLECHSTEDHKGGFDATAVANLIKGGKKAAPAIIPGKPDDSPLIAYVRGLRTPQMPKGNPPLSEQELHLLRLWILAGANDDSATVTAADQKSGRDLPAMDPQALGALSNDPAIQKALNTLLFSSN